MLTAKRPCLISPNHACLICRQQPPPDMDYSADSARCREESLSPQPRARSNCISISGDHRGQLVRDRSTSDSPVSRKRGTVQQNQAPELDSSTQDSNIVVLRRKSKSEQKLQTSTTRAPALNPVMRTCSNPNYGCSSLHLFNLSNNVCFNSPLQSPEPYRRRLSEFSFSDRLERLRREITSHGRCDMY